MTTVTRCRLRYVLNMILTLFDKPILEMGLLLSFGTSGSACSSEPRLITKRNPLLCRFLLDERTRKCTVATIGL